MSCELFRSKTFHSSTMAVIEQANAIIAEYLSQGFMLTLRQLFYQFVARASSKIRSDSTSGSAPSFATVAIMD